MLIQNLEQKTRLALITVIVTVIGCVAVCALCIFSSSSLIMSERNQIYVLDGDIPFVAKRAMLEENFVIEAKAHVSLFHQYFFTLPPDEQYIRWTMGKAMYLADNSALRQKQTLEEKGMFNDIVTASASCSIYTDSITYDERNREFRYYGTQLIKRRSKSQKRTLITGGYIEQIERTPNNPHGLLITNWRIIENSDLAK